MQKGNNEFLIAFFKGHGIGHKPDGKEIWFDLEDVRTPLGYTHQSALRLCPEEIHNNTTKQVTKHAKTRCFATHNLDGTIDKRWCINRRGVVKLTNRSDDPIAEEFQNFVEDLVDGILAGQKIVVDNPVFYEQHTPEHKAARAECKLTRDDETRTIAFNTPNYKTMSDRERGMHFGAITNVRYQVQFGGKAPELRKKVGLKDKDKTPIPDLMSTSALQLNVALQVSAARIIHQKKLAKPQFDSDFRLLLEKLYEQDKQRFIDQGRGDQIKLIAPAPKKAIVKA